jgi:hypothetical protein
LAATAAGQHTFKRASIANMPVIYLNTQRDYMELTDSDDEPAQTTGIRDSHCTQLSDSEDEEKATTTTVHFIGPPDAYSSFTAVQAQKVRGVAPFLFA